MPRTTAMSSATSFRGFQNLRALWCSSVSSVPRGQYSITRYSSLWCWHSPRRATTLSCVPAGQIGSVRVQQWGTLVLAKRIAHQDDIVSQDCREQGLRDCNV